MILKGDKTTSGGIVIEGDATMTNAGTPLAYQGSQVSCPTCKTTGVIANVPPYLPMTFCGGRQVALEGDLCLCACDPKPKLLASRNDMFMTLESHELAQMGFAADGTKLPPPPNSDFIAFKANESGSLSGLHCVAHFDDGSSVTGYFDHHNTVRFENPTGKSCTRLEIAPSTAETKGTISAVFLTTLSA
ncbi:PAAR domain-containing protein [Burkholderia ubonensis]|uniref:PAAR domain-containing protein n=1 Tax=Burkholderia ubonensis TaxID=101571 RepID=UPI002AB3B47F|nr:PAAR domain-containing protein [Burkholderia ubonensis]MDY7787551.1 PAAR domain-containing protein [Burkholderia ubonensis]